MSDFGTSDHYVAAVKAKILSINPGLHIVDVSHEIEPFNLAHASYVLNSVFREFPKGTVHIAAVDSAGERSNKAIAVKLEDHFFVGTDNGLFSLISDREPAFVVEIMNGEDPVKTFPAKNIFAKAAAMLASGSNLNDIGTFTKEYKRLVGRKFRATKKQISGNIIRVDHYGNLVTNIEKEVFDLLHKDRKFVVSMGREKVDRIHLNSHETEDGDCFVIFNSSGLLEIGINKGNASELLGLQFDSTVNIVFDTQE